MDLYNISSILVSVDSGPAHFASLTDIKTISIFGPDTPRVFAPFGENCICLTPELSCHPCFSVFNGRKANCRDEVKPCLLNVTPEKVYKIVKESLYISIYLLKGPLLILWGGNCTRTLNFLIAL
jgi:ADP-heptose:LPS heptosyltransferase